VKASGGMDSWQWRLLELKDQESRLCCAIIRSSLHNNGVGAHTFPRFAYDAAIITEQGDVMARQCVKQGDPFTIAYLGPIKPLINKFRDLCDRMKLSDADRLEVFLCFRQWFRKDYRATSNMEDDYKN
jgi:hypothetical protein